MSIRKSDPSLNSSHLRFRFWNPSANAGIPYSWNTGRWVHWSTAMSAYESFVVDLTSNCAGPNNIAGARRLEEPNCPVRPGYIGIWSAAPRIRLKPKSGGLAPRQARRALELMSSDLSGRFGLRQAASACRLSVGHFSYAFKQTVGCSPHQWLLARRIALATDLLLHTDQPLSEIALVTGFADQSHFTRVFSRRMGDSPAAWRRAQSQ